MGQLTRLQIFLLIAVPMLSVSLMIAGRQLSSLRQNNTSISVSASPILLPPTHTATPVQTPTNTPSPTATHTSTPSPTPTHKSTPSPTPTQTPTPVPTSSPTPTNTPSPTPTHTPPPVPTSVPPTATPTITPTLIATSPASAFGPPTESPVATETPTPTATPQPTNTPTATPAPDLNASQLTLLKPTQVEGAQPRDNVVFEWTWTLIGTESLPENYGFEVRVSTDGGTTWQGIHDSLTDNQNGVIVSLGQDRYQLTRGVSQPGGILLWSVWLMQIGPEYSDQPLATATPLEFELAGTGGGSSGGGGGGSSGGGRPSNPGTP